MSGERPASDPPAPQSLWRGRLLLIVGIVLLGISLRHAVTGMAPFLPEIRADLDMGDQAATLLTMLPTLLFGLGGFATPVLIRRAGLETAAVVGMLLAGSGTLLRVLMDSSTPFLVFSAVALLGMGMGNVVGAPLVKKYFPDRPAPMLTVFALLMQAGATIPAIAALPLAEAGGGWRFSIGFWALLSFAAAVPWVIQLIKVVRQRNVTGGAEQAQGGTARFGLSRLATNPVSVGTALFYAMASLNTYAMLGWMPTIFQDLGHTEVSAGTAYSIFTFLTLPLAAISPVLGSRLKDPFAFAAVLSVAAPVGYVGLLLAPQWGLAWAVIIGLIGGAFPLAIAMFNRRTRTEAGSGAISGFAMGVGYLFGTLGPLLAGGLNTLTGTWTVPLVVFTITGIPMLISARMMTKPGRYLEDSSGPGRGGGGRGPDTRGTGDSSTGDSSTNDRDAGDSGPGGRGPDSRGPEGPGS